MKKYVFAGASQRALKMFCKPMLADYQDIVQVCGVYDINYGRAKTFAAESGADFTVSGGNIRFVLLNALGEPEFSDKVTADDLREAMEHLTTPF